MRLGETACRYNGIKASAPHGMKLLGTVTSTFRGPMSEAEFRQRRRQQFLTEKYFQLNRSAIDYLSKRSLEAIPARKASGNLDPFGEGTLFQDELKLLRLHYTAGAPIESLRPLYAEALQWFEQWHGAYHEHIAQLARESGDDLRTDGTPARFDDLFVSVWPLHLDWP